jgi:hypothetical protein
MRKQDYDKDVVSKLLRENKYTAMEINEGNFVKELLKCTLNENTWAIY